MKHLDASRRLFLRHAGALSTLGLAGGPLALNLAAVGSAAAQTGADYKAIVCIFLFGGNDSINMVLPTDSDSWTNYTQVRRQAPDSIALLAPGTAKTGGTGTRPEQLGGVLALNPANAQGRSFALHPVMTGAQALFNIDRRLAILPSVGPLVMPTSKAQYGQRSHPRPQNLFSHNDQQNTWQSFRPEGATEGWGGRMVDLLMAANAQPVFSAISTSGNAVWLAGQSVRQYQVGGNGAIRMGTDGSGRIFGSTAVGEAMQRIVSGTRGGHVLEADFAAVSKRSLEAELTLRGALKPASDMLFGGSTALEYANPQGGTSANSLAQQLQVVARMIDASSAAGIGARRQVFMVSLGGFDTHDNQNRSHADLMARLSHALRYFDDTLGRMGARNVVTTFTASDFGRTFTSNGDGTDHGWGAHHLVMGGAVKGGDLYGNFPVLGAKNAGNNNFDSSPNQLGNGSLLPETSVDQLGATLGRWFGLSDTQLLDIFPNLANFDASRRNLGFMA